MDDEAALLAAIAQHPEADLPRLAYADWLDENGSSIRAEFIRVQHAVKKLEELTSAEMQGYADLYRRQDFLLTHHRRDLLGPLGDEFTDAEMHNHVRFERGFLAELRLDAKRLVTHGLTLAALKPWPALTLGGVDTNFAPIASLGTDTLALITSLELQSESLSDPGCEVAAHGHPRLIFRRLKSFQALHCNYTDGNLEFVLDDQLFPVLTQLNLAGNEISDEGVRRLIQSALWPRLQSLVLDANPISDAGAELLAAAPPTTLRYLNVRFAALTSAGQQRLLRRKGWNVALF